CRGPPSRRPGAHPRATGSGWSRLPPWATHPHVAALGPALIDAVVDAADLEVRVLGPQVAGGVAGHVGQDQPLALRVLPDLLGPLVVDRARRGLGGQRRVLVGPVGGVRVGHGLPPRGTRGRPAWAVRPGALTGVGGSGALGRPGAVLVQAAVEQLGV